MNDLADRQTIRQRFDAAAAHYDEHAALPAEVGARLLERLDGLHFEPTRIIDLGCATGRHTLALRNRYPKVPITAIDQSAAMLRQSRAHRGRWRSRFETLRADLAQLPIAEASHDLIHANLSLQWSEDLYALLCGVRRIMRPGGLAMLTLPGPDALIELRQAGIDVHCGITCHAQDLGDLLTQAGFQEPVLDTDWLKLNYGSLPALLTELDHLGVAYGLPQHNETIDRRLSAANGRIEVTWEVLYATAWSPDEGQPIRTELGEEASFSVTSLGVRRRRN